MGLVEWLKVKVLSSSPSTKKKVSSLIICLFLLLLFWFSVAVVALSQGLAM
jgi:hypothetical protein